MHFSVIVTEHIRSLTQQWKSYECLHGNEFFASIKQPCTCSRTQTMGWFFWLCLFKHQLQTKHFQVNLCQTSLYYSTLFMANVAQWCSGTFTEQQCLHHHLHFLWLFFLLPTCLLWSDVVPVSRQSWCKIARNGLREHSWFDAISMGIWGQSRS